jgi:hypothetical protein
MGNTVHATNISVRRRDGDRNKSVINMAHAMQLKTTHRPAVRALLIPEIS